MRTPTFRLVEWSLSFGMNAEKIINYVINHVKRAQLGRLRGSITFHFNDGTLVSVQTTSNDKPEVDEKN